MLIRRRFITDAHIWNSLKNWAASCSRELRRNQFILFTRLRYKSCVLFSRAWLSLGLSLHNNTYAAYKVSLQIVWKPVLVQCSASCGAMLRLKFFHCTGDTELSRGKKSLRLKSHIFCVFADLCTTASSYKKKWQERHLRFEAFNMLTLFFCCVGK